MDILTIRDRYRTDDAVNARWHFLQVDELARLVHRHRTLALSVTQIKGELATGDALGPGCLVELVEGQFNRLACSMPETPVSASERHQHARSVGASWELGDGTEGHQC